MWVTLHVKFFHSFGGLIHSVAERGAHACFVLSPRWWHGRVDLHVHTSFCCGNGGLIDSVAVWGVCMFRYPSAVVLLLIRWLYGLHVCVSFSYGNGGLIDFCGRVGRTCTFSCSHEYACGHVSRSSWFLEAN